MLITYDEPGALYDDPRVRYDGAFTDTSVWPVASDVRLGVQYGPTGKNFTGNLIVSGQSHTFPRSIRYNEPGVFFDDPRFSYAGFTPILWPDVADVRSGIAYGPTGTEYVGTMVVGEIDEPEYQPARYGSGIFRWPNQKTAITPLDPDDDEIIIKEQNVAVTQPIAPGDALIQGRRARSLRDQDILFLR